MKSGRRVDKIRRREEKAELWNLTWEIRGRKPED
jgi:hypothetical protein